MCGIAGILASADGATNIDLRDVASRMLTTLSHRGPDDSAVWADLDAHVALGHRRLAVVDLSPNGRQPMMSHCGRYVISYNGEIYNHRDLRDELMAQGSSIQWRGHSDTEVALAAISAWGLQSAVRRFVGMFAFALWDRSSRLLYLIRDRIGEKPLYYASLPKLFLFSSELKGLRAHPEWKGTLAHKSLASYLRFGYVPAPHSIYEHTSKVLPGTILKIDLKKRGDVVCEATTYWSARNAFNKASQEPLERTDAEAIELLDSKIRQAVRAQMEADVPLGAFLSGGIDSSTVVAVMQAQSERPVHTFSIGFREDGYDEAGHARVIAQHIGTRHTELYVTARDAMDLVPALPNIYDEPFADPSQIPTTLVARLARQHVTVSLSGDGGDELFGGYNRYFWARRIQRSAFWLPYLGRRLVAGALKAIPPSLVDDMFRQKWLPSRLRLPQAGDKLHKLADVLPLRNERELYRGLVSMWQFPEQILQTSVRADSIDEPWPTGNTDFESGMMLVDSLTYLPDDILVKLDRAAMSCSLESRVPMLDHRIVEFAWSLPIHMKIREGRGKWILQQVLARYVPAALFQRPKMGFSVPIGDWLRGPLRDWAEDLLQPAKLKAEGWFSPSAVEKVWRAHLSGRVNRQYPLWVILMFQAWLRQGSHQETQHPAVCHL